MRHLFAALIVSLSALTAPACDEASPSISWREGTSTGEGSSTGSTSEPKDIVMPEPQVGDIVIAELIPDRSAYLMNAIDFPLKGKIVKLDLTIEELPTIEFTDWLEAQRLAFASELNIDQSLVIGAYRFDI